MWYEFANYIHYLLNAICWYVIIEFLMNGGNLYIDWGFMIIGSSVCRT